MWFCVGPDERAAALGPLAAAERVVPDAAAGAVVRLEDEHRLAGAPQLARGGQAGQAGADHDHVSPPRARRASRRRRCPASRRPPRPRLPRPAVLCVSACSCRAPSNWHPAADGRPPASARAGGGCCGQPLLAAEGLVAGTSGNVSARSGDHVAITPTGARPRRADAGGGGRGRPVGLARRRAARAHLRDRAAPRCLRALDAGGVVHTHPPTATALSCVVDEVPCVHYEMLRLGGPVPVARYETFGTPAAGAGA